MAAKTTAAVGNYNVGATWTGGAVPAATDTVTINHAVTIPAGVTVLQGHSPGAADSTQAILIGTAGSLINNGTLYCRGDFKGSSSNTNRSYTQGAGGRFFFDASLASVPATAIYVATGVDQSPGSQPNFQFNGTTASHCVVSSVSTGGAAPGNFAGSGTNDYCLVEAYFTDFSLIGDASNYAFTPFLAGTAALFSMEDCTFTSCGGIDHGANHIGAASVFSLKRCKWSDTKTAKSLRISSYGDMTTGTRRIERCVFDKKVDYLAPRDFTIINTYHHDGWTTTTTDAEGWAQFDGNTVRITASDLNINGPVSNYYLLMDFTTSNPHGFQPATYGAVGTYDMTDGVYEYTGTASDGDCIVIGVPGSAATINMRRNIFLPNSVGQSSGTAFSALGGANATLNFEWNTDFLGTGGGVAVGENYTGHAGMLAKCRNNIFWDTTARAYAIFDSGTNDNKIDLLAAADCTNNTIFNALTGSNGVGINNLESSTGTFNANGLYVDPQFVDSSRNLKKWDLSLGGAGTVASALARLQVDPSLCASSLLPYVRAGFAVQATALRTGAHDGTVVGAVQAAAGASGGTTPVEPTNPVAGAVPMKAEFWSMMNLFHPLVNQQLQNDALTRAIRQNDSYYDGLNNAYQLLDHFGDTYWATYVTEQLEEYRDWYINTIAIGFGGVKGAVAGFWVFLKGLVEDYLRRGDAVSRQAAIDVFDNGSYVSFGDCSGHEYNRECAYALFAHMQITRLPGFTLSTAQLTRRQTLYEWALAQVDQFLTGIPSGNSTKGVYVRPFMIALTARSLIHYWKNINKDPRILTKLKAIAEYIWTTCWKGTSGTWGVANAFTYTDRVMTGHPDASPDLDQFTQPDLNLLIAPLFGWLYHETGESKWRSRGDLIWTGGVPQYTGNVHTAGADLSVPTSVNVNGKHCQQQMFWATDYITDAEATPAVGPTPSDPDPTPDPDPGTDPGSTPTVVPATLQTVPALLGAATNFASQNGGKLIPCSVTCVAGDTDYLIYIAPPDTFIAVVGWLHGQSGAHILTFKTTDGGTNEATIIELELDGHPVMERITKDPILFSNKGWDLKVRSSIPLGAMLFYVVEMKSITFN
jgi:hypothetical protein